DKLRLLFGDLLKEVQRIKSQGDYEAGKALVENYGVKVDANLHQQVLDRSAKLDVPPYAGFVNPEYIVEYDEAGNETGNITITYPDNFIEQMLNYGKNYSYLN